MVSCVSDTHICITITRWTSHSNKTLWGKKNNLTKSHLSHQHISPPHICTNTTHITPHLHTCTNTSHMHQHLTHYTTFTHMHQHLTYAPTPHTLHHTYTMHQHLTHVPTPHTLHTCADVHTITNTPSPHYRRSLRSNVSLISLF